MAGIKPLYTCFKQAVDDGLVFNSFEDNTGGWGYKANFAFDGYDVDGDNCFLTNATWNVSQSNAPYLQIAPADSPSSPLSGLTAKVVASERPASNYQGNIEIYPLPAGSFVASWIYNGGETTETISFSVGNTELKAKDLSSGTLASSISASTSTLSVYVGEGTTSEIMSVWPTTPFYATIMPVSPSAGVPNKLDSEIVLVSDVSVDGNGNTTLSVSRGQRGTTAKAFSAGDIITNASYSEDALIISDEGTPEDPTPWITADMLTPEARRQIAEESGVVAYINGARGGNWGSTWAVYTDTTYANIYPADEIDDAIEAGVSVVFRTNDNYDLRILGRFSVDSTYKYYTVAYDGFLLGTLRLTISSGLWNYTESQVQTADIADSAITTAKISSNAVTNAKIDWSSFTTSYTECDKTGAIATPTGNCRVAKIGKIVNLQVNYSYTSANAWNLGTFGDEKIATIPEGYRPQFHIYGAALVKFTSTTITSDKINTVHLWVNSSGEIRLNNMDSGTITGVTGVRGLLTWVIS